MSWIKSETRNYHYFEFDIKIHNDYYVTENPPVCYQTSKGMRRSRHFDDVQCLHRIPIDCFVTFP